MNKNIFPPRRRKNNTSAYIVSAIISIICIAALAMFFIKLGKKNNSLALANDNLTTQESTDASLNINGQKELRGVWIASVININFPSKPGLSEAELKSEIDTILKNTSETGLNAVFFQVRPTADALYKSDIFPASKYVSGTSGIMPENNFDCLEYILKQSKEYGIEVHAWINPYRVTMYEGDEQELSPTSPAVLHPEYTVKYADGKTYFNPGIPEVRELVVSGVKELLTNYPDISGIHYDDYFYPYPKDNEQFDDTAAYEKYSDGMSLEDWRRDNVNKLVKETYDAVKSINPDCRFGVSTFGIWANATSENTPRKGSASSGLEAYSALYCDALSWVDGGYVDYIAPQNYWSFNTSSCPFDNIARWWNANLDSTGVDLYMGHAAYKAGEYEVGEIARQVEFCRSLLSYKGSIFYGYDDIVKNSGETASRLKELYSSDTYFSEPIPTGEKTSVLFPENGISATEKTYVLGSSDPAYPVTLNGEAVSRTKQGYFGAYLTLSKGQNSLVLSQNGSESTTNISYGVGKSSGSSYRTMSAYEIGSTSPSGATWINVGDTLKLGCAAPAGSIVTATIGGMTVILQPTINPPEEGELIYEYYTGQVKPSAFAADGEVKALGTLIFNAERGQEKASKSVGLISQAGKDAYYYVEVSKDYTHTKVGTTSSFYDDFLPSSAGMRDYAVSLKDGFYKLRFGGYVSQDNVSLNYGRKLMLNKLLTTAVSLSGTPGSVQTTTDIRFGITENIPVDVDFRDGFMRIIMYNTDTSVIPSFDIPSNPMIESIEGGVGTKENVVIYRVKLKDLNNFYGFNIVYDNGMLILKLNNPQTLSSSSEKPLEGKTIVVDAGHGGSDIGAPGPGSMPEAALNFNIATRLASLLRELGATVLETRTDNITVSLYERMDFLNDACPDLAVSIHHNSVASSSNALKANGFVALYSNNSGVLLAKTVSKTVCKELNRLERSPSYQQLAVARNHRFPSALFEMCFISNVEEYQWSISQGNFDRSAKALADGILDYYRAQGVYLEY